MRTPHTQGARRRAARSSQHGNHHSHTVRSCPLSAAPPGGAAARRRGVACRGRSGALETSRGLREDGFAPPVEGSVAKLARQENRDVEDKLIAAFQSKPQKEWRKLIAFSKKWPQLKDGLFTRCAG